MNKESVFTIDEVKQSSFSEIIIKNNSTNEFVSIIPGYGGRLKELWLNNGKKNISIIKKINRIDSTDRDEIFANAKLSPFAGRISDGKYIFNNTTYNLGMNYPEEKNACHGFIYDKKFLVTDKNINDESACCKLEYKYEGGNEGYPFKYSIEIDYNLSASDGLKCTTKVTNNSKNIIPFGDGWHHYYDLGFKVNELELRLDVCELMELDSRNIPTGNKEAFSDFKIPAKLCDRSFDSCFKINARNGKVLTELISTKHDIHLNIWQETGNNKYEYLVIYTPPDRKTIAIEPMTSNVNAFNNGEGLIKLSPGEEYESSFGIYLIKS